MQVLSKEETAARIAKNVAAMIDRQAEKTFVLNLGVGIPTQVATYVTNENVYIHAENGMVGVGPLATPEQVHPMLINAGRQPVTETAGCAYMDSSLSFGTFLLLPSHPPLPDRYTYGRIHPLPQYRKDWEKRFPYHQYSVPDHRLWPVCGPAQRS